MESLSLSSLLEETEKSIYEINNIIIDLKQHIKQQQELLEDLAYDFKELVGDLNEAIKNEGPLYVKVETLKKIIECFSDEYNKKLDLDKRIKVTLFQQIPTDDIGHE